MAHDFFAETIQERVHIFGPELAEQFDPEFTVRQSPAKYPEQMAKLADRDQIRINQEFIEIHVLAQRIANNEQLKLVVKSATPFLQKQIYEALNPHLSFKPKPYLLLK